MKLIAICALLLAASIPSMAQGVRPPEPMDVGAIQVQYPASHPCNISPRNEGGFVPAVCITGPELRWECINNKRVLLTSEDGAHHCILFPDQEPEIFMSRPIIPVSNDDPGPAGDSTDGSAEGAWPVIVPGIFDLHPIAGTTTDLTHSVGGITGK